jgi:hypothetical protein
LFLAALAGLALGGWAKQADAAPWCGTPATSDRAQVLGGPFLHVVYAIPSDGADHSPDFAQRISGDVDQIAAWWTGQDPTRAPRFDVTPFSCGNQVDLTLVRLPQAASQLAPHQGRAVSLAAGVMTAGLGSAFGKYLVYYDGPVEEPNLCGEAGGAADSGPDYAFVYTASCVGVPTAAIAAHELLHALSALPQGAPHPCSSSDDGHPCDSEQDILYPFASGAPLSASILDFGRDDYYGHSGNWFDLQDSIWLTHLGDQAALSIAVRGGGKVVSLEPSPDCTATCSVDWNRGSNVQLEGIPAAGKRFVRWTGGCTGTGACSLMLGGPTSVGAFFAPARFRLSVTVAGKGIVRSTPRGLACRTRCGAAFTSYKAVRLTATSAKAWRFARWTGSCTGTRPTCSVPMTKAASARAVFVRR